MKLIISGRMNKMGWLTVRSSGEAREEEYVSMRGTGKARKCLDGGYAVVVRGTPEQSGIALLCVRTIVKSVMYEGGE